MTTQRKTLAMMLATCALGTGALMAGCGGVPISAPKDVAVSNGVLTWTEPSGGALQVRIERQVPGSTFETLAIAPAGTTQYRDPTAVRPGTTYTYRLLAMNADAPWSGSYSRQVSFTPGAAQ